MANERLESGLVNCLSFVNIDCTAHIAVETRIEETSRILQRRAPRALLLRASEPTVLLCANFDIGARCERGQRLFEQRNQRQQSGKFV